MVHTCDTAHATVWGPGSLQDMWLRKGTAALQSCSLSPHIVGSYRNAPGVWGVLGPAASSHCWFVSLLAIPSCHQQGPTSEELCVRNPCYLVQSRLVSSQKDQLTLREQTSILTFLGRPALVAALLANLSPK